MTFQDRFQPGRAWEVELANRLRISGWGVCEFGQGQLSDEAHGALRDWRDSYGRPSLVRWLPDLLAWRTGVVYMIDAKTETEKNASSPNVAVECDAFGVGGSIEQALNTPMLFVWRSGAMTPRIIENRWHRKIDGNGANGSGTSFLLIDKKYATSLTDLFGSRVDESAA